MRLFSVTSFQLKFLQFASKIFNQLRGNAREVLNASREKDFKFESTLSRAMQRLTEALRGCDSTTSLVSHTLAHFFCNTNYLSSD